MKLNKKKLNRWLIVRQGAVGDTILLSPLIQSIRHQIPNAWIEVMGVQERCNLLVGRGLADKAVSSERPGMERLYSESDDLQKDLLDYFYSFDVIFFFTGNCNQILQKKLSINPDALVRVHPALPPPKTSYHCAEHYLSVLDGIIPYHANRRARIQLNEDEINEAETYFEEQQIDRNIEFLLAFHPGAGSKSKRAPVDFFAKAANAFHRHLKTNVLFTQGPADGDAVFSVKALLEKNINTYLLDNFSLRKLAAILSLCHQFIGNDSGITHMAAALELPTLAVFTQSDPQIWSPLGTRVRVITYPPSSNP